MYFALPFDHLKAKVMDYPVLGMPNIPQLGIKIYTMRG
jgi:hypothetical protein